MKDIRIGNSIELIKHIPDRSIDCVITSPPYWGLRDYGHPDQIGLEKTPEEYLTKLVTFFDDVSRKLKDTGTCFVNLGDTYWGSNASGHTKDTVQFGTSHTLGKNCVTQPVARGRGFAAKCVCMIPQRFAWMMIEHGWVLRNEIIWNKPNHMPESVRDRFQKAHEIIYFFTKQGKYYFNSKNARIPFKASKQEYNRCKKISNPQNKYTILTGNQAYSGGVGYSNFDDGKIVGDVWDILTNTYKGAHFATFPEALIKLPILSGCPEGGTVLDPFAGSGTVGRFCEKNKRNSILFDCNDSYKQLMEV